MADDNQNQNPMESASADQMEIPQIRLQHPLPPLPRMRIHIPFQSDSPLSAYTDDSFLTPDSPRHHSRITLKDSNEGSPLDEGQTEQGQGERTQPPPPDYEPMHDYLLALALHRPERSPRYYSPTSNTFLSPSSRPQTPALYMPYRDSPTADPNDRSRPAIITLSPLSPSTPTAPPSYEELYLQHPCPVQQSRLLELVRQLEASDTNIAEEICKFVIGFVFIVLTVVIIGMVFNWGRPVQDVGAGAGADAGASRFVIPDTAVPVQMQIHNLPRLGSMTKLGKFKTLCGGRCKIHSA